MKRESKLNSALTVCSTKVLWFFQLFWFKLYLFDFTADIYNTCIRHMYVTGFDGKHWGLFESSPANKQHMLHYLGMEGSVTHLKKERKKERKFHMF